MYTIIPMTRLGQESYQKSRSDTYKFINELIFNGTPVYQVTEKFLCNTKKFPEGHLIFPGSIIIEGEVDNINVKMDQCGEVDTSKLQLLKVKKRIAFLNGKNCAPFCFEPFQDFFNHYGLKVDFLSDIDIRNHTLANYELLIVPGGPDAGESYYEGLGELGYEEIRKFIHNGGLYLGSCAGSYFPLSGDDNTVEKDVWLNLIEATDKMALDYWRTGTGFVRIQYTDIDHPICFNLSFGNPSTQDVIYWEGPVFHILNHENINIIATYKDFLASSVSPPTWPIKNNPIAVDAMAWSNPLTKDRFDEHMKDQPAIIEANCGKGHLVLLSPHAEFGTCGTEHIPKDNPNYTLLMNSIYYLSSLEESK